MELRYLPLKTELFMLKMESLKYEVDVIKLIMLYTIFSVCFAFACSHPV